MTPTTTTSNQFSAAGAASGNFTLDSGSSNDVCVADLRLLLIKRDQDLQIAPLKSASKAKPEPPHHSLHPPSTISSHEVCNRREGDDDDSFVCVSMEWVPTLVVREENEEEWTGGVDSLASTRLDDDADDDEDNDSGEGGGGGDAWERGAASDDHVRRLLGDYYQSSLEDDEDQDPVVSRMFASLGIGPGAGIGSSSGSSSSSSGSKPQQRASGAGGSGKGVGGGDKMESWERSLARSTPMAQQEARFQRAVAHCPTQVSLHVVSLTYFFLPNYTLF